MTDRTWPIVAPGVWLDVRRNPGIDAGPVLFLDRDGVIVEDNGFPSDPDAARLMPGAVQLVAAANRNAIPVAIVTNQSGIDRGLYGWAEFAAVQSRIEALLAAQGAAIDALAACPFHPDFTPGYGPRHAAWRKPGPAMLTALAEKMRIDAGKSWLVGDRTGDIEAARAARLAGGVLVGTAPDQDTPSPRGTKFEAIFAADVVAAGRALEKAGLLPAAESRPDAGAR